MRQRRYGTLKAFLEATGETQAHFAARVGCQQAMVSRILDGKAVPSFSLALRIAKAADIPVESLAPQAVSA